MRQLLILLILLMSITSCKVGRFAYYNFANITDHKIFPNRSIENDTTNVFQFYKSDKPLDIQVKDGSTFEDYLIRNQTVAFLVIHHDTIKYERYFRDYDRSSIVASFSMAKSFTSFLIGCAIEDGYINSVQDPITQYLPELKDDAMRQVTIENLLQMTSGITFNESYYNPFGHAATFYYGQNLRKASYKLKAEIPPNETTNYISGNTQLLGLILDRVLTEKTISQYLEERLWRQIGMEYDASWSIDKKKNGIEKTFCCINARAIDFAKFGRLYLKKGNWQGEQIVSKDWVERSTEIDTLNGSTKNYQYQWWLPNETGDFIAEGILGQFIYVSPDEDLIIVRLGEAYGDANWERIFEKFKEIVNR